tara:strand:- start:1450 stop:2166 length:717 start_codon:yes stop_codon:yes gene_type:complete
MSLTGIMSLVVRRPVVPVVLSQSKSLATIRLKSSRTLPRGDVTQTYSVIQHRLKKTNPILWKNLPKPKSSFGLALCYLWDNPAGASRAELIDFAISNGAKLKPSGDSLQMRHLSTQKGFNITHEKDWYKWSDMSALSPSYVHNARDKRDLDPTSWNTILKKYDSRCVNCGSVEGSPMRWDPRVITKLQTGHMDPRKALTIDNCIPQCRFCNQQYKDKAVFNKRGIVIDFLKRGFKKSG